MDFNISSIDIGIVIAYFIIVLMIGFWIARQTKTGEDLFLGGRSFGWGLIGLSLFASNISSSTIIGLTGKAYSSGIVDSVYEWMSGLPLIIAALIFIPMYLRSRITTIPEFLEKRFDRRSQLYFSGMSIFMTILIETAGSLYAGTLVLQTLLPSWDLGMASTSLVLALIAGAYTASGGLKAVVYTDALQAIILIVGCSILTYLLLDKADFNWDKIVSNAPEDHFSVVRPADDKGLPWPGLIMGVPFLGFWYWSTNQYIIQRALGAKDLNNARWGMVLAGFLKVIPLFIMVIPGAIALTLYPDIVESDTVFPFLVTEVLPVGLIGLVLAGLISAILSSVDSALNSSSTLVVIDFIKPNRPNLTQSDIVKYGRITTIILMLIAAAWSPIIAEFSGLWDYLQSMFAIAVPPIAIIFLVGVFYKRGNGDGAFWTLILGTLAGVIMFCMNQFELWGLFLDDNTGEVNPETGEAIKWTLHYTYNVGICLVISAITFVVVSRMTPAPNQEQIEMFTYKRDLITEGTEGLPWYKNYLTHIALLVALIAYILIVLW